MNFVLKVIKQKLAAPLKSFSGMRFKKVKGKFNYRSPDLAKVPTKVFFGLTQQRTSLVPKSIAIERN